MEEVKKIPTVRIHKGLKGVEVKVMKTNHKDVEVDRHCFEKDEGTSW
jgi:hypothetical protein